MPSWGTPVCGVFLSWGLISFKTSDFIGFVWTGVRTSSNGFSLLDFYWLKFRSFKIREESLVSHCLKPNLGFLRVGGNLASLSIPYSSTSKLWEFFNLTLSSNYISESTYCFEIGWATISFSELAIDFLSKLINYPESSSKLSLFKYTL